MTGESELSERKLAEVVNDEVGSTDIKKHLNTQKGLNDFSHVPAAGETTSSGSKTVLVKTVRQMQRAADHSNKVRFLGFHRTVREAAAECRARKFGERLRFLQGRRKVLVEKERARRAELGLANIKLPIRRSTEMERIAYDNQRQFIKICHPIQYSTRPDPGAIPNQASSPKKVMSFQTMRERLLKRNVTSHRFGTRFSNSDELLQPVCHKHLSYSRFLCKELGATSAGLKRAAGNNAQYVPIHIYDKPPHGHNIPNFRNSSNKFYRFSGWWKWKKLKA